MTKATADKKALGLFQKFNVSRTDGRDAPGEKHHGAEYFVLDMADTFAIPALTAYAEACKHEYPVLSADLFRKASEKSLAASEFITVPEVTLPNGLVVPSFLCAKFLSSQGLNDTPISLFTGKPWVEINYQESRDAALRAGLNLITETQALAIAFNVSQQAINWTGGEVGNGALFQGLRNDNFDEAQPANVESEDETERRWFELSNGERIYDFAGNAYTWVFDDVQGDENGLTTIINADSPSLTTAPFPSREKGMGWRPDGQRDWSGHALIRGGCWLSESYAGAFYLVGGWPGNRYGGVGFRCTKPIGL
jgi:hypothetical protein